MVADLTGRPHLSIVASAAADFRLLIDDSHVLRAWSYEISMSVVTARVLGATMER